MEAPLPEEYGLQEKDLVKLQRQEDSLPTRTVISGIVFGLLLALVILLFAGFTLQNTLIAIFLFGLAGGLIGLYMAVYQQDEVQRLLSIFSPVWRKYARYRRAVRHYEEMMHS